MSDGELLLNRRQVEAAAEEAEQQEAAAAPGERASSSAPYDQERQRFADSRGTSSPPARGCVRAGSRCKPRCCCRGTSDAGRRNCRGLRQPRCYPADLCPSVGESLERAAPPDRVRY